MNLRGDSGVPGDEAMCIMKERVDGQFVDFAAQLFVCLLIESPIFDVDGDDTGNDLQEVSLRGGKFTRVGRLNADDADETLFVAKEDDRYGHEPMIFGAISAYLC